MTKPTSPSEKLVTLLVSKPKHFVSLLIHRRSQAIKHLPAKESLIDLIWKRCVVLLLLVIKYPKFKKLTISTLVSLQKSKWMTLLDNLSTLNLETLSMTHIQLFQMLGLELISKEKVCQPFWTPAYKVLSEKLLSPTEIDLVASDLTSSKPLSTNVEAISQSLITKEIKVQNKNCQKTYYLSSISSVADKWAKEVIKSNLTKALTIKLKPSKEQRVILDEWINTSNYVYNKTVEAIHNGHEINFMKLRDKLVTKNTKKTHNEYVEKSNEIADLKKKMKESPHPELNDLLKTKNIELRNIAKTLKAVENTDVSDWECKTPKEVRAGAVDDVCKAYKTGFANLKAGNIKFFNLDYRKNLNTRKSCLLPKNFIKVIDNEISIAPTFFSSKFKMGKKTKKKYSNLEIKHDCRIIKDKGEYFITIPIDVETEKKKQPINICGVDPGVRTFMTSFGNTKSTEYIHNQSLLNALNQKLQILKSLRTRPRQRHQRNKYRKACLSKIETRKTNLINEVHWKTINHLLTHNDCIFYGDIKSHDIVKDGVIRTLNRNINDLKFYTFKQRLLYKASVKGKGIFLVNEAYTSQTCSCCGKRYKPGSSKVYSCSHCITTMDRDVNASKNILMKGILG